MVFFFSEFPVTGPPSKNNRFIFKESDFSQEVVKLLPIIKSNLEQNTINIKTIDISFEETLYESTGVKHHAYKNGYPINSTNKGFKLVPDKKVYRIPTYCMADDMFVQTLKFAESIKELKIKNDLVLLNKK